MPKCFFDFRQHAAEIHCCGLSPGDDVHVNRCQNLPVVPEYFSNVALDPVTDHSTADLFAYRNPEPRLQQFIRLPDKEESLDKIRTTGSGKPDELCPLPQSGGLGKRFHLIKTGFITSQQCERPGFCGLWPFCA